MSDTSDDPVHEPVFLHREPNGLFTVAKGSAKMADPGLSAEMLATQLRGFAQRRLIHVRDKRGSGRTAHNLYGLADLAAAKVLTVLTSDLRMADNDLLAAASWALYQPSEYRGARINHAIHAALDGTHDGKWWVFRLDALRHDQTGELKWRAYLYDAEGPPPKREQDGFLPRAATHIQLRPLFLPLLPKPSSAN